MSLLSRGGDASGEKRKHQEPRPASSASSSNRSASRAANTKSQRSRNSKTTLGSLLKYMEGYEVIVELKTGKRHRGRLASADDNMNLLLEEDSANEEDTAAAAATTMRIPRNIRGSSVRYVHFPDNADLTTIVRSGRERERQAARKYQKTRRKSSS